MIVLLVLLFSALMIGAFYLLKTRRKIKKTPPLVRCEYWVYGRVTKRPSDKQLLERLLKNNPHYKKGSVPIGSREGVYYSDVRFHIGIVPKETNQLMFRPEVIGEPDSEPSPDIIRRASDSQGILRVLFVSEKEKILNKSHVQFITHATDAVGEISNGTVVFDVEAQQFFTKEEFYEMLQKDNDGTRFDLQVVVRWKETPQEGCAFTRGMAKIGLPDLLMEGVPHDHKTLALYIVQTVAKNCWDAVDLTPMEIEGYGEMFFVEFGVPRVADESHRGWVCSIFVKRLSPQEVA